MKIINALMLLKDIKKNWKGHTSEKGKGLVKIGTAIAGLGGAAFATHTQFPEVPNSWILLIEGLAILIGSVTALIGQLTNDKEDKPTTEDN